MTAAAIPNDQAPRHRSTSPLGHDEPRHRLRRTTRCHGSRRVAGFTLIELLIVVALLALLATVSAPLLGPIIDRNAARAAADALAADLAFARSEAVRLGRPVSVCPSREPSDWSQPDDCGSAGDWTSGWVVYTEDDGNVDVRRVARPSPRIDITTTVVGRTFNALGLTVAGSFEVAANQARRCVTMQRSGTVTTEPRACS